MKTLNKGKHVLVKTPLAVNAIEAEALSRSPMLQKPNAPILLEAMHHRFQPSWQYFLSLVDQSSLDHVVCIGKLPSHIIPKTSVQLGYETGGGNLLNLGTYGMCVLWEIIGAEPEECTKCAARRTPLNELCDEAAGSTFRFPHGPVGEMVTDMRASVFILPTFIATVVHKEVPAEDFKLSRGQMKFRIRKATLNNFLVAISEMSLSSRRSMERPTKSSNDGQRKSLERYIRSKMLDVIGLESHLELMVPSARAVRQPCSG